MYIVTTKQARFTHTLLNQMAGVDIPMERIFSTTVSGAPKTDYLTVRRGSGGVVNRAPIRRYRPGGGSVCYAQGGVV